MRKRLIFTALAISMPACAQFGSITYCVNCGTEITQGLTYARQALQYANEISMLEQAVKMGTKSPSLLFSTIGTDLMLAGSLAQGGQSIFNNMAHMDATVNTSYGNPFGSLSTYGGYYPTVSAGQQTTVSTLAGTLRSLGQTAANLNSQAMLLNSLRGMSGSAVGTMQQMQTLTMVADQTSSNLLAMHNTMIHGIAAHSAFMAQQTQREMGRDAATQQFFNYAPVAGDGRTFSVPTR